MYNNGLDEGGSTFGFSITKTNRELFLMDIPRRVIIALILHVRTHLAYSFPLYTGTVEKSTVRYCTVF